jgi:thiosulfate dehydrogenase
MRGVLIACCIIGAVTVGATLTMGHANLGVGPSGSTPPGVPAVATEDYGKRLLGDTQQFLGPSVPETQMRYIQSGLACGSCHMGAGADPGELSLLKSYHRYPRVSPRSASTTTIVDRINGCMRRSMNGRPLPANSPEMLAMVAWVRNLSDQEAAMGASERKAKEPPAFRVPDRAANLNAGKQVFEQRCAPCHGKDGSGLRASKNPLEGYVFPPLWGPNSFNTGAGMHRVLTAARFIKARMPLGKPDLTDDQAFDVAAYVNSQPRPEMANLQKDFPDRTAKPVDCPYGPYADPFPIEQHRFGPFQPIEAYYKKIKKDSH